MNEGMRRRAQSLRSNATPEENKLWYQFLRTYPVQWNRQKVIQGYIVDFFCWKAKLVVELDGAQHFEEDAIKYDEVRTEILNSLDLEVLRFTNREVNQQFQEVCSAIHLAVQRRIADAQKPSPGGRCPEGADEGASGACSSK